MSIANGQKADANNLNAAFVSKAIGSTTTGILDLFNTAMASGARILNVQQAINELFDAVGMTGIGDTGRKTYSSTAYVANGDSRKAAIGKLDAGLASFSGSIAGKLDIPVNTSFTIANNTAAQDVAGLLFDMLSYRSALVEWSVYRKSTGGGGQIRAQAGSFYVVHDDTNWALTDGPMSGAPAGVTFDVTAATGQVKIDADDNGGTYSAGTSVLKFKVVNATEV